MADRAFEKEFFNIANYIYELANGNSTPTTPTKEILLRTYTNRIYYYMYHSTRKKTLQKIRSTSVNDYVNDWRINVEDIFREHKLLREFYQRLGDYEKGLGLEKAEDIAETLNIYSTYRVLADYYIKNPTPTLGGKHIDFTSINPKSNAWKLLNPAYLKGKIAKLLENISSLFEEIEENGYSYDVAKILNELDFKRKHS